MLLQYAREHHFPNPTFFVDDGVSGVTYDRPGFQAMLAEIEAGRVAVAIAKDLSRLGRNSALTGLYTNFTFPQNGVRFIAINDNYDTIDPNRVDNDFAGIKNWFNEFYARDTSRKIRAVQKAKGERGVPLTPNVPYGYVKDLENPRRWVVDPVAADVVKRIFDLCKSAKRIVSMILQEGFTKIDDLDSKIDNAERTLHQRLAPSQRNAVKLCLSHPISIMTGGPGSGKTTTLRFILDIYKAAFPANEVLLAAPTGRASRRMAEQTGMHASTLHSALGLVTDEDSPLNDKELLSADLVVVDEFSMVDMRLAYILLDRIKSGAQLIIVGDADQLPSVGAGNVLREMIRSEKVPTAVLETVFRQASNSRIITNAYAINHNDTHLQFGDDFQFLEVQNSEEAAQLVIKNYLQEVSLHGIEDVQILSPLRKRGAVAANALNETIRDLVNPPNNLKKEVKCGSRVFRVGDRIMQTANRINVSNGDVGVITDMKKEDDETITCVRLLDGRTLQYTQEMLEDLEFSYCTTIHKSQGQEYPVIIVPLLKEHYIMLRRNLLYTAVTRAKAKVILIGQKQAVFVAIHKCDVGQRNTVLADRIVAYYNRELSRRVA